MAALKARHLSQYAGKKLEACASDYQKATCDPAITAWHSSPCSKPFWLEKLEIKITISLSFWPSRSLTRRSSTSDTRRKQAQKLTWLPTNGVQRCLLSSWRHGPYTIWQKATFGNIETAPYSATQAEVPLLSQSQVTGTKNSGMKGNCHKRRQPGWWATTCPDLATTPTPRSRSSNASVGSSRQDCTNKHQFWQTIPPLPGTSNSKKGRTRSSAGFKSGAVGPFTHTTATHIGWYECASP